MPGKMNNTDEKKWQKAKRVVRKQKGKRQSKFTDRDWGLVQHIFKNQKSASELMIIVNALDQIGEFELSESFDSILENI
jgi:hypothetical protein